MSKLKRKFVFTFSLIALLSLAITLLQFTGASAGADGAVLNIAGAQRMLIQKIAKEALLLAIGRGDAQLLRDDIERFTRVLRALKAGDEELQIPPASDPGIEAGIDAVQRLWTPYRETIESVIQSPGDSDDALLAVRDRNPALLRAMDEVVRAFERRTARKVRATLVGSLAVLLVSVFATYLFIVSPIIKQLASTVAGGERLTEGITTVSKSLETGSDALSLQASSQAASLEQTSTAMAELESQNRANAQNASAADAAMKESVELLDEGLRSVQKMALAMKDIDAASSRIARITESSEEIAFQTHILALNAAVEAARAGDAGRGFTVVADEVRRLAKLSSDSAQQTATLIKESRDQTQRGNAIVEELEVGFGAIQTGAVKIKDQVGEISERTAQQADALSDINTALETVNVGIQESASHSLETATASQELNTNVATLNEVMRKLSENV